MQHAKCSWEKPLKGHAFIKRAWSVPDKFRPGWCLIGYEYICECCNEVVNSFSTNTKEVIGDSLSDALCLAKLKKREVEG